MNWKVTTQPTTEPVSRTEAKLHLRVDHTADDDLIDSLVVASREWCEAFEGRAYMTQTITGYLDAFCDTIELPRPPLLSVTSVKYYDTSGVQQTLDSSYYDVDTTSEPGRITLAYSKSWPATRDLVNAVEIIYKAGYNETADNSDDVPGRVKAAIKLVLTDLYENRGDGMNPANDTMRTVRNLLCERSFT